MAHDMLVCVRFRASPKERERPWIARVFDGFLNSGDKPVRSKLDHFALVGAPPIPQRYLDRFPDSDARYLGDMMEGLVFDEDVNR